MNIEEMKKYYNNNDSNYSVNILESYIEIDKYNQNFVLSTTILCGY